MISVALVGRLTTVSNKIQVNIYRQWFCSLVLPNVSHSKVDGLFNTWMKWKKKSVLNKNYSIIKVWRFLFLTWKKFWQISAILSLSLLFEQQNPANVNFWDVRSFFKYFALQCARYNWPGHQQQQQQKQHLTMNICC